MVRDFFLKLFRRKRPPGPVCIRINGQEIISTAPDRRPLVRPLWDSLVEAGVFSAVPAAPPDGFPKSQFLCVVEGCNYSKSNDSDLCPYHRKSAENTAAFLSGEKIDGETFTKEAALFLANELDGFDDEGPFDEGWKSDRLSALIDAARTWLKQNPGERENPSPPEKG